MLTAFQKKNPYERSAVDFYRVCLAQSRQPVFYEDYGVPDSFDGRFDLLVAHLALVMNRLKEEAPAFNQALFDVFFADMDQTLREMGIGDMGVPKHMKRMMTGFNGRIYAYGDALDGAEDLGAVLKRNLFGTAEAVCALNLKRFVAYMQNCAKGLGAVQCEEIISGAVEFAFPDVKMTKKEL